MNVPISEESQGNIADDIWHRHESEIRSLYQTKSLVEVKAIMEAKPGFPKLAIKTWNEKLGKLGIERQSRRKKKVGKTGVKRGDKKLKKMIKDTEVLLGNKKFGWDEVWRNIRRAGVIVEVQPDPPSPLPTDIFVQTPRSLPSPQSPHSSLNTSRPRDEPIASIQSQEPALASERSTIQNGTAYLDDGRRWFIQQPRLQTTPPNNPFTSTCLALSDCIKAQMMLHLPSLPIWNFSDEFAQMANLDLPSRKAACDPRYEVAMSLQPNTELSIRPTMLLETGLSNDSVFHSSDLLSSLIITQSSAALATFSARERAYITVAMAIYLLSNNFVRTHDIDCSVHRGFFESLDSIFAEIPARHLQALLQSRLASVRSAFEALLKIAGRLEQRVVFKSLVEIGITNDWLARSAYGHGLLYHAVCMDLYDVVQQLVESGCRPEGCVGPPSSTDPTTAIIKALERHNLHCVQLLLKYCGFNKTLSRSRYHTSFTIFIQRTHDLDEMRIGQGIKLFLDAGADINSPLGQNEVVYGWEYTQMWSVRDYLFCYHRRLFYKVLPNWAPAQDLRATRAGFLTSVELGPNASGEYYSKLAQNISCASLDEYLELLVAEEFMGIGPWGYMRRREIDLKTVGALVDFGVSMEKILKRAPHLLAKYMEGRSDCDLDVIRYLLDNGATVDDRALVLAAVRLQDTGLLSSLI